MLDIAKKTISKITNSPLDFAIGGLIHSFWFLIVPYIFILGYIDRTIHSVSYGIPELPKWNHWKNLFIRGIKLGAIILIYLFPSFFVLFLSPISFSQFSTQKVPHLSVASWIGITLFIVLTFLLIGGIASYVKRENLVDAFNIREIIYALTLNPKEYIKIYLWLVVVNFFSLLLIAIPFVGLFVYGFVNFYILLVGYTSIIEKLGGVKVEESKGFQTQEEYYY